MACCCRKVNPLSPATPSAFTGDRRDTRSWVQSSPLVAPAIAPHESGAGWYAKVMLLLVTVDVVAITAAVLLTFRVMFSAGAHTLGVAGVSYAILFPLLVVLRVGMLAPTESRWITQSTTFSLLVEPTMEPGNGRLFAWTSGEFRLVIYPALWKGPQ